MLSGRFAKISAVVSSLLHNNTLRGSPTTTTLLFTTTAIGVVVGMAWGRRLYARQSTSTTCFGAVAGNLMRRSVALFTPAGQTAGAGTTACAVREQSTGSTGTGTRSVVIEGLNDIESDLPPETMATHQLACDRKEAWYTDPSTKLMVATRHGHIERGRCCGNRCRHCPYGHVNVPEQVKDRFAALKTKQKASTISTDATTSLDKQVMERGKDEVSAGAGGHKASVYTKTGDRGTSALFTGERRSKTDPVFMALGDIDELSSAIGVVRATLTHHIRVPFVNTDEAVATLVSERKELAETLEGIQRNLLNVGSIVATPDSSAPVLQTYDPTQWTKDLEATMDLYDSQLPPLTEFILPGGTMEAAQLHMCRSVCRRAERTLVILKEEKAGQPLLLLSVGSTERDGAGGKEKKNLQYGVHLTAAMRYVNRLSDFFFVAARYVSKDAGTELRRHTDRE